MASNRKRRIRDIKQGFLLFFLFVAAVIGISYYYRTKDAGGRVTLRFADPAGRLSQPYKLEVAATPQSRRSALRYRNSLPADHGVIFVYPAARKQQFSTADIYVPIDLIALGEDFGVVSTMPRIPINAPEASTVENSKYIVVLPAGAAAAAGVKNGWKGVIEGEHALPRGS